MILFVLHCTRDQHTTLSVPTRMQTRQQSPYARDTKQRVAHGGRRRVYCSVVDEKQNVCRAISSRTPGGPPEESALASAKSESVADTVDGGDGFPETDSEEKKPSKRNYNATRCGFSNHKHASTFAAPVKGLAASRTTK